MVKFITPKTVDEALTLIAKEPLTIVAGATDQLIKTKVLAQTKPDFPHDVLYLGNLEELKMIDINKDKIVLGSAVTFTEILDHPDLPELIKRPCREIASPAIRNQATIGGNLVNASPSGDALTMLYALDATVIVRSLAHGQRLIPIETFITGPKKTCLKTDELVIGVQIPSPSFNHLYYRKVGARSANAITKVSLYAVALTENGTLKDLRLAFGAVGPTIMKNREIEKTILDADPQDRLKLAMNEFDALIHPIDDVRSTQSYRKQVAMNLLEDAIKKELSV